MIEFDKKKHQYKKESRIYDSVTTVISKYKEPYDSAYWSVYKACKDVISGEGEHLWYEYKKSAGKWDEVPAYYKKVGYPHLKKKIEERRNYYLDKWDESGHKARVMGTLVHTARENEVINNGGIYSVKDGESFKLALGANEVLLTQGFDNLHNQHTFVELIVSNDEFEIAGMVDRVDKFGKEVYIIDYKTSKEIKDTAFMDKTMLYPLNDVPDCNRNHYGLQLSLYGWILAQQGYVVKGLKLVHLIPPSYDLRTAVSYELNYRPEYVERMITHYRKKQLAIKL